MFIGVFLYAVSINVTRKKNVFKTVASIFF